MLVKDLIANFNPKTKFELVTHWVVDYINQSIDEEIVTRGIVSEVPVERMYLIYYDFTECWIENDTLFISQEVVQEVDEVLEDWKPIEVFSKFYLFALNGENPYQREVTEDEFRSAIKQAENNGYLVFPEKIENLDYSLFWLEKLDENGMPYGNSVKFGVIETIYN